MTVPGNEISTANRREKNKIQNMGDEILKMNKWN
jgi:hypothetical protein